MSDANFCGTNCCVRRKAISIPRALRQPARKRDQISKPRWPGSHLSKDFPQAPPRLPNSGHASRLAKFLELENNQGHCGRCNDADVTTGVPEIAADLLQRKGRQGWATRVGLEEGARQGKFFFERAFDPSWTVPSPQRRSMGWRWRGSERSDYDARDL